MSERTIVVSPGGPPERPRELLRLWTAVLAGPLAWVLALNLQYALVRIACTGSTTLTLHVATLVTLAAALGGAWLAWIDWRRGGGGWRAVSGGPATRARFLHIVGMAGGVLFALAIVAQWVGTLFLHPCMGV